MDRREKIVLAGLVAAACVGGVAYWLARQGLSRASLWVTVLGLPLTVIGTAATVLPLVVKKRSPGAGERGESSRYATVPQAQEFGGAYVPGTAGPSAVPLTVAQLPPLVAAFTGRDHELAKLTEALDPTGAQRAAVTEVIGMPGVGKTALAVQAANAVRERGWYQGGVLFIDLDGYGAAPAEPTRSLDVLLRALEVPPERIPPSVDERAALYRSRLASIAEPVLVIADNAATEAQVRPLLPGPGPHRMVITSRDTFGGLETRQVILRSLDPGNGVSFLEAALRTADPDDDRISGDPASARRLAEDCDGLPLALHIVAAQLTVEPELTTGELAGRLAAERDRLVALRYDDGSDAGSQSVVAAFELSYRPLKESLARVFRLLPLNPGPDIRAEAAAALADLPGNEARSVLGGLARANLIEGVPGAGGRWRMHDLVRLYAQQLSAELDDGDGQEEARDRLFAYYLRYANAADQHLRARPGRPVPDEFSGWQRAFAWFDEEQPNLVAAVSLAADTGRDQIAFSLSLALAQYLSRRGRFGDKLAVIAIGLTAARNLGDRHDEGVALTILGGTLPHLGRFDEAITACQEAATILAETPDRSSEAQVRANLGIALARKGRFGEAIAAYQTAITMFQELGDRDYEAQTLVNVGLTLERDQAEQAITAFRSAQEIYQETGNRNGEASALASLGGALKKAGQFGEAATACRDAANIYRETGDWSAEASALIGLGLVLWDTRQLTKAIVTLQEAVDLCRSAGDRPGEAMALQNLGAVLHLDKQSAKAITVLQDAAAIFREIGDQHGEADALNSTGIVFKRMRRFDAAIIAFQEAADFYQQTGNLGQEAKTLADLSTVLRKRRRFREARTVRKHAAAIHQAS